MLSRQDVVTSVDRDVVESEKLVLEWIEIECPRCGSHKRISLEEIDDIIISDTHDPDYIVYYCTECNKYRHIVGNSDVQVSDINGNIYTLWSDTYFTYLRDKDGKNWRID